MKNLEVEHDPLEDGDVDGPNPAHTLVKGKKTQGIKTSLKVGARVVWRRVPPSAQTVPEPDPS